MTNQDKIALLEEMLELDSGELNAETQLEDLEDWNSMASLSLIVVMDEEFGKKITGAEIREFKTIQDILDFME